MSLTNTDYSAFELLHAFEEVRNTETGRATSADVAEYIDPGHSDSRLVVSVGQRLSWFVRYGWMEKEKAEDSSEMEWWLSDLGQFLLHPEKLNPAVQRALDGLTEAQRVQIIDLVAAGLPTSSREAVHLARRTVDHYLEPLRDPSLAPRKTSKPKAAQPPAPRRRGSSRRSKDRGAPARR